MNQQKIELSRAACLLECMATNMVGALQDAQTDNQRKIISEQIDAIDIALDALQGNPEIIAKHRERDAKFEMQRQKTRFERITESPEKLSEFIDEIFTNCEAWCPLHDPMEKYIGSRCDGKCKEHMVEYLNEVI